MEKSVVEAAEGVDLVTNAGSELDGIVSQVSKLADMNFQIATAAGQQSSVAEEMSVNPDQCSWACRSFSCGCWWAVGDLSAYGGKQRTRTRR